MRVPHHHSRQVRQFRYLAKQLKEGSGQVPTPKFLKLIHRFKGLYIRLSRVFSATYLRKIAAGAAFYIGIAGAPEMIAQPFNTTPLTNPFGLTSQAYLTYPTFVDIDADGDLDMLATAYDSYTGQGLKFYENIGAASEPGFASETLNPFGSNLNFPLTTPSAVDIDNDGDYDLFFGRFYSYNNPVVFVENTGTAETPDFSSNPVNNPFGAGGYSYYVSFVDLVDIDNDGDYDLFRMDYYGALYFYENIGTPESPAFDTPTLDPFGMTVPIQYTYFLTVDFVDFDGDGDYDLFSHYYDLSFYENRLFYLENTGTPESPAFEDVDMTTWGIVVDGFYVAQPAAVDIDADGDIDIFASIGYYGIQYFENLSDVSNSAPASDDFIVVMDQDDSYTFAASDFPFTDPDGDELAALKIVTLPATGELTFNGTPVMVDQTIAADDIGMLTFAPVPGEFGDDYASFDFEVGDGSDFSVTANTVNFNVLQVLSADAVKFESIALNVFPNPSAGIYEVSMDNIQAGMELKIYNLLGILVQTYDINASGNTVRLDLTNAPNGVYWLNLQHRSGVSLAMKRIQKL